MIDLYATERHYLDHLLPLAARLEGRMLVGSQGLAGYATERGVVATVGHPVKPGGAVLVASKKDAARVHADRRLGLLEHGAGQTYVDNPAPGNYPGGPGWGRCGLFLVPGPHSAAAWRAGGYEAPVVELGGVPRLDGYFTAGAIDGCWDRPRGAPPVVAVSFHWDARAVAPEAASTWRFWVPQLRSLVAAGVDVLGHGHPRAMVDLEAVYGRLGIRWTRSFELVLAEADVYCCDNSSTLYEFAALERPVVCLNAPTYRRDVSHGLRFWGHMPGLDVWPDESLELAVARAVDDGPALQVRRQRATTEVYGGPLDGRATDRAVAAVLEHLA